MQPDLCQTLREASLAWLERAAPLLRERARLTPMLEVRCDLRGKAAGQVRHYADGRLVIRYNLGMARLQPRQFIAETVPHEVAHVITWLCHGRRARPHGEEWRAVMRHFGIEDAPRCHDFAVPPQDTRRQRRWSYRCDCQTHQLSSTRHNRVLRGQQYLCRSCGQPLRQG